MPTAAAMVAALRRPRTAVEAGPGLCRHCRTRPAVVGEPEPLACRPCVWRLAAIAADPSAFPTAALADLWSAHEDVVRLGQVVVHEHMVVEWPFLKRCQHLAMGWVWLEEA